MNYACINNDGRHVIVCFCYLNVCAPPPIMYSTTFRIWGGRGGGESFQLDVEGPHSKRGGGNGLLVV